MTHRETGNKVGIRKIRDSIFVKEVNGDYEISNHKWRLNDYDQEGWVSMQHADDRPLPTFVAAYDEKSKSLTVKSGNMSQRIFIDAGNGKLYRKDLKILNIKKLNRSWLFVLQCSQVGQRSFKRFVAYSNHSDYSNQTYGSGKNHKR